MLLKILIPLLLILQLLPLMIWLERKVSALIQDRPGPERASILGVRLAGLVHSLADVLKLFTKEEIIPSGVHRPTYLMAPGIALFVALVTYLVVPFADTLSLTDGAAVVMQGTDLSVGILYILAISSLGVYGVMLAGWSSNNKYALLGGIRSSAQMISYELTLGLSLLSIIVMTGSFELGSMVTAQTHQVWNWHFFTQPLAALLFIVSTFAETNRAPFDLPEGESELVAGYHVEYSSMKFAQFFMAEYIHMIMASALIATVFLGGWQVPFVSTETLRTNAEMILQVGLIAFAVVSTLVGVLLISKFKRGKYGDKRDFEVLVLGVPAVLTGLALLVGVFLIGGVSLSADGAQYVAAGVQVLNFLGKILSMCLVFIWVRWTLPRFRYDQLMHLGWKVMLPLAMLNLLVTAFLML
jgi:NADH-quinone oxidoreductase subunit H